MNQLKLQRIIRELTQVDLAKKAKIAQGDLSQLETGKRPITKKMAARLSKALGALIQPTSKK